MKLYRNISVRILFVLTVLCCYGGDLYPVTQMEHLYQAGMACPASEESRHIADVDAPFVQKVLLTGPDRGLGPDIKDCKRGRPEPPSFGFSLKPVYPAAVTARPVSTLTRLAR